MGVIVVGIAALNTPKKAGATENPTTSTGIILIVVAQFFTGIQFIVEEKLLSGYYLDPIKVVGLEGLWGFTYYLICLPIMNNIKCSNKDLCVPPYVENSVQAFKDLGDNSFCLAMALLTIVSIANFNVFGVSLTKYASAAQRATVDTTRTVVIWAFQLIIGAETINKMTPIQLIGFILLIIGTLVYNEIWIVPIGFMKYNTAQEIEKREAAEKGMLDEDGNPIASTVGIPGQTKDINYMNTSPKGYDANRNQRNIENAKRSMGGDREKLLREHDANAEITMQVQSGSTTNSDTGKNHGNNVK